jgi:hypothetical protein
MEEITRPARMQGEGGRLFWVSIGIRDGGFSDQFKASDCVCGMRETMTEG